MVLPVLVFSDLGTPSVTVSVVGRVKGSMALSDRKDEECDELAPEMRMMVVNVLVVGVE